MAEAPVALTIDQKAAILRAVTHGFAGADERWRERAETGLTDEELAKALAFEFGIEGGSSPRNGQPAIWYRAAGLSIWVHPIFATPHDHRPILSGQKTIALARRIYGIPDPSDDQMSFL